MDAQATGEKGCQKDIAQAIRQKQAHYVLAVKDNQRLLYQKVQSLMDDAIREQFKGMEGKLPRSMKNLPGFPR